MDDNVVRFPRGPYGLVSLRDIPEPEPVIPWYAGYPEFRHKMQFAPSMLSVVTGHPGHGKTSLMAQLWFNMASNHNLQVTVASFESSPMPAYRKMVRQFWAGLPQAQMTTSRSERPMRSLTTTTNSWSTSTTRPRSTGFTTGYSTAAMSRMCSS